MSTLVSNDDDHHQHHLSDLLLSSISIIACAAIGVARCAIHFAHIAPVDLLPDDVCWPAHELAYKQAGKAGERLAKSFARLHASVCICAYSRRAKHEKWPLVARTNVVCTNVDAHTHRCTHMYIWLQLLESIGHSFGHPSACALCITLIVWRKHLAVGARARTHTRLRAQSTNEVPQDNRQ